MFIFDKWLSKKKQLQPKTEIVRPVEPEKPKTIMDVGRDVIYTMEPDEDKRRKLCDSLKKHEEYLLGRMGPLFVSSQEIQYFIKVMQKLGKRPVVIFDFNVLANPLKALVEDIGKYKDSYPKPIVFVVNYYQEKADQADPHSDFDSYLRDQSQHERWAVIMQGDRSAKGSGGNILGSSISSAMAAEEMFRERRIG